MTSASPPSRRAEKSLSNTFTTAAEFYNPGSDEEPDEYGPRAAKAIVWFDPATPLFICEECHEHVKPVEGGGATVPDDPLEVRTEAYRSLFEDDGRPCDCCSGRLAMEVRR